MTHGAMGIYARPIFCFGSYHPITPPDSTGLKDFESISNGTSAISSSAVSAWIASAMALASQKLNSEALHSMAVSD